MTYVYAISFFASGVLFSSLLFAFALWRVVVSHKRGLVEKDLFYEQQRQKDEQIRLQESASISKKFEGLAAKALKDNSSEFLGLAQQYFSLSEKNIQQQSAHQSDSQQKAIAQLFEEMRRTLGNVDVKMSDLEKNRVGAYQGLLEQVKALGESQLRLQTETSNLSKALRSPNTRGRWGEFQLRRVVEMSGMLEHCDFITQVSSSDESVEGASSIRPDLVVKLPGNKQIVIDAKTPIEGYLKASEVDNEMEAKAHLTSFAKSVRQQIVSLSQKSYWQQFESSPDFVVMFLPGESFFSVAVQQDPTLIEFGVERKVLIATPTTLIALLRTAAYGWKQEALAENAKEISKLGAELHSRMQTFLSYVRDLGDTMHKSIKQYNKMVGGLESRVLTTAKKFEVLSGINTKKESLQNLTEVNLEPRTLKAFAEESSKDSRTPTLDSPKEAADQDPEPASILAKTSKPDDNKELSDGNPVKP